MDENKDTIFNVTKFEWNDLNVNIPSTDEHLFPFELIRGKEFYQIKILHKYKVFQNNKTVIIWELSGDIKTAMPSNKEFPIEVLLYFIKETMSISRQQLEIASATQRNIRITFQIPPDDMLRNDIRNAITNNN